MLQNRASIDCLARNRPWNYCLPNRCLDYIALGRHGFDHHAFIGSEKLTRLPNAQAKLRGLRYFRRAAVSFSLLLSGNMNIYYVSSFFRTHELSCFTFAAVRSNIISMRPLSLRTDTFSINSSKKASLSLMVFPISQCAPIPESISM